MYNILKDNRRIATLFEIEIAAEGSLFKKMTGRRRRYPGNPAYKRYMIPFCKPSVTDVENRYMLEAAAGKICGDGPFTERACRLLAEKAGLLDAMLTTSCTHALELAAMLCNLKEGDEVILPSFTFSSTANAFLLQGATLRFCEIDPATMNVDIDHMYSLVNRHTRVLAPIDYAGIPADIDAINRIAEEHLLLVVQDAAQSVGSSYKDRAAGIDADFACYSFHETKNYVMGEGGAIRFKNPEMRKRAEIVREKGTDRSRFWRGEVDKYTWQEKGSSYLPSDVLAAMLAGQLERFDEIMQKRLFIWDSFNDGLKDLEDAGLLKRPTVPDYAKHNGHIFYILLPSETVRNDLLNHLRSEGVGAVFHYVPLHSAPSGIKQGYQAGDLPVTEEYAARLLRLPLFPDLTPDELAHIIGSVRRYFEIN